MKDLCHGPSNPYFLSHTYRPKKKEAVSVDSVAASAVTLVKNYLSRINPSADTDSIRECVERILRKNVSFAKSYYSEEQIKMNPREKLDLIRRLVIRCEGARLIDLNTVPITKSVWANGLIQGYIEAISTEIARRFGRGDIVFDQVIVPNALVISNGTRCPELGTLNVRQVVHEISIPLTGPALFGHVDRLKTSGSSRQPTTTNVSYVNVDKPGFSDLAASVVGKILNELHENPVPAQDLRDVLLRRLTEETRSIKVMYADKWSIADKRDYLKLLAASCRNSGLVNVAATHMIKLDAVSNFRTGIKLIADLVPERVIQNGLRFTERSQPVLCYEAIPGPNASGAIWVTGRPIPVWFPEGSIKDQLALARRFPPEQPAAG